MILEDAVYGNVTWSATRITADIDVDSNNDNGVELPNVSRTEAEDEIEDDPAKPGKFIAVNDGDVDGDGVPDFADGFTTVANNVAAGGTLIGNSSFIPVTLSLSPGVDPATARVRITYTDASDPRSLARSGAGTTADPYVYTPAAGTLRLWTRPGTNQRSGEPAGAGGGDFVLSGGTYALSELNFAAGSRTGTLYAEAVGPSALKGDVRVIIEVDPDGNAGLSSFAADDAVRLSAVRDRASWQRQALKSAGINANQWQPAQGFDANESIVRKVYDFYASQFTDKPNELLWAGLARMAGRTVFGGFVAGQQRRSVIATDVNALDTAIEGLI